MSSDITNPAELAEIACAFVDLDPKATNKIASRTKVNLRGCTFTVSSHIVYQSSQVTPIGTTEQVQTDLWIPVDAAFLFIFQ